MRLHVAKPRETWRHAAHRHRNVSMTTVMKGSKAGITGTDCKMLKDTQ